MYFSFLCVIQFWMAVTVFLPLMNPNCLSEKVGSINSLSFSRTIFSITLPISFRTVGVWLWIIYVFFLGFEDLLKCPSSTWSRKLFHSYIFLKCWKILGVLSQGFVLFNILDKKTEIWDIFFCYVNLGVVVWPSCSGIFVSSFDCIFIRSWIGMMTSIEFLHNLLV